MGENGHRRLYMTGHLERREGKTTALLDLAIGNARRGERVLFLCRNPQEAQRVYRVCADLLYQQADSNVEPEPRHLRYRWSTGSKGSISFFGSDRGSGAWAGFRADVAITDDCSTDGPELAHAHTRITG